MMHRLREHLRASLVGILVLAGVQCLVQAAAVAWIYRGTVLPPYAFFATQLYDFFAKLRYYGDTALGWLPGLPDRFVGTDWLGQIQQCLALLPNAAATAVALGTAVGLLGALLLRGRAARTGFYLALFTVLGLLVHVTAAVPPLQLGEDPSLRHITYRLRSLIVDGTLAALAVWLLSALGSAAMLRRLSPRGINVAAMSVLGAAVVVKLLVPASTAPDPTDTTPSETATEAERPYNVVLISLDSLRADRLGCYGHDRETSPTVDRLAREGIRFSNAVATSSWTLPTHLTMFTGRYQISHGVTHDTETLDPGITTLGQTLKNAGYSTAGFISGPYVAGHYGYDRGMDTYVDLSQGYGHRREARSTVVAPAVNDHALGWLDEHAQERFFLFLHYFDIHYDYIPPAPYDTLFDPSYQGTIDGRDFIERDDVHAGMDPRDLEHILALYDGEIRFTDEHVKAVIAELEQHGVLDDTLIVLVSDHGEEFFEHGNKGHHRTVYKESLHIPFIVRSPGAARAGEVVEHPVSLVDVMPTILGYVGLPAPAGMEGVNVLATGDAAAVADREAVYGEFYDKRGFNVQVARRTPTAKTIQHFNRITHPRRGPVEYYELDDDSEERDNRYDNRRDQAWGQLEKLSGWLQQRWQAHRTVQARSEGGDRDRHRRRHHGTIAFAGLRRGVTA